MNLLRLFHNIYILLISLIIAVYFPITPDEKLRCILTNDFLSGSESIYNTNWSPLLYIPSLISYLINFDCIFFNRFFNFLILINVFIYINYFNIHNNYLKYSLLILPYLLVMAIITLPQLLTFIILVLLVKYINDKRIYLLTIFGIFANPITVPIIMAAILFYDRKLLNKIYLLLKCIALILICGIINYFLSDNFNPFFNSNGGYNIFLGNNPDPLSPWGYGSINDFVLHYDLDYTPTYTEAVIYFINNDFLMFIKNLIYKLIFYIIPYDNFKADTLRQFNKSFFISAYIAIIQLFLYYQFIKSNNYNKNFYIILYVCGWLIYSAFTIKVRYRMPFDFLLWCIVLRTNFEFKK